jgi:hypothetical protein
MVGAAQQGLIGTIDAAGMLGERLLNGYLGGEFLKYGGSLPGRNRAGRAPGEGRIA